MAARDPHFYLVHIHECYTKELGTEWPTEFRQVHAHIPWRSIINTRNLLIHAYDEVNPAVLGDVLERDIQT